MAEFELDGESVSRAKSLSSHLVHDLRQVSGEGHPFDSRWELFSERHYSAEAEGVPINDVVANVGQMAAEFAVALRREIDIPCLKLSDGDLAPISLTELNGATLSRFDKSMDWKEFWARLSPSPLFRRWRNVLLDWPRKGEVVVLDVREAAGLLERNLDHFLSYRFAGAKKWAELFRGATGSRDAINGSWRSGSSPPGPAASPGGGLQVQVSCRTAGLRLHVSPSYFITWIYFGSPTTPVTSYLLPGRYVFAADGPRRTQRTQDQGVFSIPPTYQPVLVSF